MKKHIILLTSIALLASSCATLFNPSTIDLTVITTEPRKISVNGDTIDSGVTHNYVMMERSKEPLNIKVYGDDTPKEVIVPARNSLAYVLNFYPSLVTIPGILIDQKAPNRYTYPKTIFIDVTNKESSYLKYDAFLDTLPQNNLVKVTPLKLIGLINPGLELSYERKLGRHFSTEFMGSYLFGNKVLTSGTSAKNRSSIEGFRVGVEPRFYLFNPVFNGNYVALELNYLNNRYKDVWNFGEVDPYLDTSAINLNYEDSITIKKQTFSINLKLGYQYVINRISVDAYIGFGLRYKDVRHFDRINPDDDMEGTRHPNIYYIANFEGKYWTISMPLNVKIGYSF